MIRRLLAFVHRATAPGPGPGRRTPLPMRGPGDLPMLRLVVTPNPVPGGPADVLLVRGSDAFLLTYPELQLLVGSAAVLADSMARSSSFYAPAEHPPVAPTLN